jgi:hypothetical protein
MAAVSKSDRRLSWTSAIFILEDRLLLSKIFQVWIRICKGFEIIQSSNL